MRKIAFLMVVVTLTVVGGVGMTPARSTTRSGALLDALPDGTAVAVIDFQKIAGSDLWATMNAQGRFKREISRAQSEMADLGVQLTNVNTVALVFSGAALNNPTVGLAGGFEQNDLLARLRARGTIELTSEKYRGIDVYNARSIAADVPTKELSGAKTIQTDMADVAKGSTSFVFYDANTLVIGSGAAVRASIDVKTGAKPGLTQNAKLTDALEQNPAAAIRFAFTLSPAMIGGLHSSDMPIDLSSITLIFGTIDVGTGIDLNATLRSDNGEHAKAISERLNALLAMASGFLGSVGNTKMASIADALKTVNIGSIDADVKITGNLPMGLLNSLLSSSTK